MTLRFLFMCAYIQVTNKQVHWQDDQQDKHPVSEKNLVKKQQLLRNQSTHIRNFIAM